MRKLNPHELLTFLSDALEKDHQKVTQSVALRGAQVTYVLNRLRERFPEWSEAWKTIAPPKSGENRWIEYGLHAHDTFTQLREQLEKTPHAPNAEFRAWVEELDNVLLDIRRIIVQNLSKHPALRPHNLVSRLIEIEQEREQKELDLRLIQAQWNETHESIQHLSDERDQMKRAPEYYSWSRLEESFAFLTREKQQLNEEWVQIWKEVSPIFQQISDRAEISEKLENAQHRMLQLYLSSPLTTREKDANGRGLVMICSLAVDALEGKAKGKKKKEDEAARETLLRALESPIFVHYAEHVSAINQNLMFNRKERDAHPLYFRESHILNELSRLQRRAEELSQSREELKKETGALEKKYRETFNELNHMSRVSWGVEVDSAFIR